MGQWKARVNICDGIAVAEIDTPIFTGDKIIICYNGEFLAAHAAPTTKNARVIGKLESYEAKAPAFGLALGVIALEGRKNLDTMQRICVMAIKQAGYRRYLADYVALQKYINKRLLRELEKGGERLVKSCYN